MAQNDVPGKSAVNNTNLMREPEAPVILVVDDNEAGRYATSRIIRNAGFTVIEAADGEAALARMSAGPCLVVLDVNLPDMSGFEVCRRIKDQRETSHIPVLHLSASYLDSKAMVKGLNGGADGYLTQPVDPQVLVATINSLLRMNRAEESLRETNAYLNNLIDYANAPIIVWDPQFKITRLNRASEILTGMKAEEVLGQPLEILFPPEEIEGSLRLIKETLSGRHLETVEISVRHSSGSVHTVLWNSATLFSSDGSTPIATIAQGQDITKRKEAERALQSSEERYRSIFCESSAVMLIIDPDTERIVNANTAAVHYYGWTEQELLNKKTQDIAVPIPENLQRIGKDAGEDPRRESQFRHRHADGSVTDVEAHSSPVTIAGKKYLYSIIHDISGRMSAERERDSLARRLSHYLSVSPTITYACRIVGGDIKMEWISENVVSILGFSIPDALSEGWIFRNTLSSDRANALSGFTDLTLEKETLVDYRFMRKNKTTIWVRDRKRLVRDASGEVSIVGTLTDATELKNTEQELNIRIAALEAAANAIIITDRDGSIEWANPAFQNLTGYTAAECIGKNPRDLVKSGKQDPAFYDRLWDTLSSGKSWEGDVINKKKSGELYEEEQTITPVRTPDGAIGHYIAIKQDVTERNRVRRRLETALQEKDILLREVHHRVKNNMQIISSLLFLSEMDAEDPQTIKNIGDLQRRIHAMAIIHELFYAAEDLSGIDFSLCLQQLANDQLENLQASPGNPELRYSMENLHLKLDTAIPAGLLASEMLSRALRSSIRENIKGAVSLTFRKEKDAAILIEVRDNSPAGHQDSEAPTPESMEMQLIGALTEQLHGSFSVRRDKENIASLRFKLP